MLRPDEGQGLGSVTVGKDEAGQHQCDGAAVDCKLTGDLGRPLGGRGPGDLVVGGITTLEVAGDRIEGRGVAADD
jgi:hypothetical protein